MLRVVCKSMKTLIEALPEIEIVLSPLGTAEATSHFFSQFKGSITVASNFFHRAPVGWFLAVIDAVQHGVKVEKISTVCVNSKTACALSEVLNCSVLNGRSATMSHIAVSFKGSSSGFRKSLSAISQLSSVACEVEISADLSFRGTLETLWGINQQLMSLGSRFTVKEICIRSAMYGNTC